MALFSEETVEMIKTSKKDGIRVFRGFNGDEPKWSEIKLTEEVREALLILNDMDKQAGRFLF